MLKGQVRDFLVSHSLLQPEDRLAVAYSGGPDSTCLLHLMRRIHPETSAIYVNHHLRDEESEREESFAKEFCEQREIPLFIEHLVWRSRPSNLEERARKRRFLHLTKVAREQGFARVALAHHRDDVAETLILRLLRGSGPRGLAGPAAAQGLFIRPLLKAPRSEILNYLDQHKIPFFTDQSNLDLRFLRNRIRHELLPHLEKHYNPRIHEALNRTARWIGEQNELLSEFLNPYRRCIQKEGRSVIIMKRDLESLSLALRKELLRLALSDADPSMRPDSRLLTRLLQILQTEENLELPGFLMVESGRERIVFTAKAGPAGAYEIDVPGTGSYPFPPGNCVLRFSLESDASLTGDPDVAYLDADKAGFPLTVRNWKKGDRFHPMGMDGTRKLSDFWIDRKVPRAQRNRVPLVFKEDELIWVGGFRLSHGFRITEKTRRFLKIELKKTDVQA